jgi:LacI family transcriptional regulator
MPTKTRLTQRDVARQAGVSQAVVSYVLNGTNASAVSADTRQRVLAAIQELGYVPDGVARGMRTGRSMLIGCVIPDITNPFYPAFQRGIQDRSVTSGYSLVTFNTDGARGRELAGIRAALQCGVDGLVVSLFETCSEDLGLLHDRRIPFVVYGALADQPHELPYDVLDVDIAGAAREVVRYLHHKGHRSLGLIDGPQFAARRNPRADAVRDAMSSLGLPIDERFMLRTDFSEQGGYHAMERLLGAPTRPTGVIAANDVIAMGMLAKAEEAGVAVPREMAIVGYDDIPAARLLRPALTTVSLSPERIGARAVELLLDRLVGSSPASRRQELLPYKLIIRESA